MADRISVTCAMNIPLADFYHIKPAVTLTHELLEGEDYDTAYAGLSYQCMVLFYRQAMVEAEMAQSILLIQGQVVLAQAAGDLKQKVAEYLATFNIPETPG